MTRFERFKQIIAGNSTLKAIYEEASKPRPVGFCRNQLWYSAIGPTGQVGLRLLLPTLKDEEYDTVLHTIKDSMPSCSHAPGECVGNFPPDPTSRNRKGSGFQLLLTKIRRAGR
jgi:hypothetical protein